MSLDFDLPPTRTISLLASQLVGNSPNSLLYLA